MPTAPWRWACCLVSAEQAEVALLSTRPVVRWCTCSRTKCARPSSQITKCMLVIEPELHVLRLVLDLFPSFKSLHCSTGSAGPHNRHGPTHCCPHNTDLAHLPLQGSMTRTTCRKGPGQLCSDRSCQEHSHCCKSCKRWLTLAARQCHRCVMLSSVMLQTMGMYVQRGTSPEAFDACLYLLALS